MKYFVDQLVNYCFKSDIISESQIPWFRYSIEKRLSSTICLIPFVILAVLMSNFWSAIWFIGGFCFLRSRINGYHAKTMKGCLLVSLGTEWLFMEVLYPMLTPVEATLLSFVCLGILVLAAPYNHPNMHYSTEEIYALKKCIQCRIIILSLLFLLFNIMRFNDSIKGLATGIAMATFMLGLAYISEWRKHKCKNIEQP